MRGRQWESKDLYEKYFKRQQKNMGKDLGLQGTQRLIMILLSFELLLLAFSLRC